MGLPLLDSLTDRERRVLEAIVQSYVETAEPVGSRVLAKRFGLGVSPATIRNAMSDLEDKGFLFHPHTSAGRIPTDRAYRLYVDSLMREAVVTSHESRAIREGLSGRGAAVPEILRRAAEVLGVLTQELGVAVVPSLDGAVLERLDLVPVSSERLLLVLTLMSGLVRTIFVQVPGSVPADAIVNITQILNERLAGLTLRKIRQTLPERLRDTTASPTEAELLDIFLSTGEHIFNVPAGEEVVVGRTSILADQPEFATGAGMRSLVALTEQRDVLKKVLGGRSDTNSLTITIGEEHDAEQFSNLTLVTSPYHAGTLTGVIGVLGPTRMPYEKVVALVEHTSKMVGDLLR